ncbi:MULTISPECIES: hypothetical protein [Salinicola]|uniref:hypothetical protein n=1 Tax=Salinicola TaxID=404432 RepID=UPI000A9FEC16|nr:MULTISPECIES: hypothetical protein [Salinicola]
MPADEFWPDFKRIFAFPDEMAHNIAHFRGSRAGRLDADVNGDTAVRVDLR